MAIVTGDRYLDLLASFVEDHAGGLLDGSLVLKLNPVGLHYVQTRLDALHELGRLQAGAPVDYLRAYISDLGDHRALEQLSRVLSLLTSVKVVSVLQSPNRDPAPVTLSPFGRLKSLELRGCDLSTSAARGLLQLRSSLERLICHNSADALRHIFADRLLEVKDSLVWSRLALVSCAANGMVFMDDSLQLLPAVQYLDLSRNRFAKAGNLHCCTKLKFLDLGFNQLRNISSLGQIKSQITKLVLKNNTLVSVHGIAALTSLEALDLSNNLISKFKEIQSVAKLPSLQSILLEGNPVSASDLYREEVFSLFQDPGKVLLDGRKILQSEFWTVNRIKSKRLKQEALYGSYAPAEVTADNQAGTTPIEHTDSGSDAGTSISRRKSLRLALIHDAQTLLKEVAEQDESPGFHASRNLSRDVKDFLEEGGQDKAEAMHLMQRVEALKEEGSDSWLQELRVLLDNSNQSSEQVQQSLDPQDKTMRVRMDSKLKELRKKFHNKRHRRRSFGESMDANEEAQVNQHLERRLSLPFEKDLAVLSQVSEVDNGKDASLSHSGGQSGQVFTADSPGILAAREAVFDQDSSVDTYQEVEEPFSMTNVDEAMQLRSKLTANKEQTSMDESFGSWRLIDKVIDSRGTGGSPRSPPHYHEDVLQKRQDLEEELLRLSLDVGCAPSSSESESSTDDSLIMISASSRSEDNSPRGMADVRMGNFKSKSWNSWQGSAYSTLENNVPNYESEESMSSGANDEKELDFSKGNSTETARSGHSSPSCTDDIRANAGGGQEQESSEMVVSKPRVRRKPRRVRTVDLYKEVDEEGRCILLNTESAVLNEAARSSEANLQTSNHMTASPSIKKQPSGQGPEYAVGVNMACAPDNGVDGSDAFLEDYVEKFFRLKIANAEEDEVCSRRVRCGCIRLWEETPLERDVHFLLSNKDKLYMIADSNSRNGKLSASGSDFGLHVLASHRLQEVKKILVGLGLQILRLDIGHGASYLIVARDINLSREILEMLRKIENNGPVPEFESWEQKQLKMFEELVLGGTQTNILMYMMPLFSHGSSLDMWTARSVFLTSHHMFVCVEDLAHFGARSEDSITAHPYFVIEAAADIYDLVEVVAGFQDDCVTLHFRKTVSGDSVLMNGDEEAQNQVSTVWKFKGVLGEAASKLMALLHASPINSLSHSRNVDDHSSSIKWYLVHRLCAGFLF